MINGRSIAKSLEAILSDYQDARDGKGGAFGGSHPVYQEFHNLAESIRSLPAVHHHQSLQVKASPGQGNWARVPWAAVFDRRETTSIQRGVYIVFLFREDMSGVYLTLNQGVTDLKRLHGTVEARKVLRRRADALGELMQRNVPDLRGFQWGDGIDLRTPPGLGREYENSTAAYLLYGRGVVPPDQEIASDLDVLLSAYEAYMNSDLQQKFAAETSSPAMPITTNQGQADDGQDEERSLPTTDFSFGSAMQSVVRSLGARGYIFEPWQIAQYVAAVRTKPFVILAGITGTGKSKLPKLIAEATGAASELIPVRPDWTDSSEVIGYVDLEGTFRPGRVLEVAQTAGSEDDVQHTLIIDEMNLARVEHYFAEVLSRIEDRRRTSGGGWESSPLVQASLREEDAEWGQVPIPANLALVGTVNMDESAHGFSRKVLDRAFTIELSEVALDQWDMSGRERPEIPLERWPITAWQPRATRLSELGDVSTEERDRIDQVIAELMALNHLLVAAQLQIGYRSRDEICLFVLHAEEMKAAFTTRSGVEVDPLDLAVMMKVLPRIAGGSVGIRQVLLGILGWAITGSSALEEDEARQRLEDWEALGRSPRVEGARYPAVAGKTLLMWDRLTAEGFTSYWL